MSRGGPLGGPLRAVVVGGHGFLGGHVVRQLRADGADIVVVGREDGFDLTGLPQEDVVVALLGWAPDVVVNAAGRTVGDVAELHRDNHLAVQRLLRGCALAVPSVRLVQLGSAAEYGPSPFGVPVAPDEEARPAGDYGRSKLAATESVIEAAGRGEVDGVVLRVFNPLGEGQPATTMPGSVAAQLARSPDGIVRVGRLDAWRDFVSAADVARAVAAACRVDRGTLGGNRVLNVGSGCAVPARDVALGLVRLAGGLARLEESGEGSQRSGDVSWQQADVTGTRDVLGWAPQDTLPDALSAVLGGVGIVGARQAEPSPGG